MRGEGLPALDERMNTMDPNESETYKFLGVKQAYEIKTKVILEHVKSEEEKRIKMLVNTELNDRISTINVKVVPVAAYSMNVCKFSNRELNELDQIVKRKLRSRSKNIRGGMSPLADSNSSPKENVIYHVDA